MYKSKTLAIWEGHPARDPGQGPSPPALANLLTVTEIDEIDVTRLNGSIPRRVAGAQVALN